MQNITKQELITKVAKQTSYSKKDVSVILNTILNTIQKEVSTKNKVTFIGFGTFENKERAARKGHNPQTGEEIQIPAKRVPTFKAGKSFKDMLK